MRVGVPFVVALILSKIDLAPCASAVTDVRLTEDASLNFTQLAARYGYAAETYEVATRDGYVLRMFRIPGNTTKALPVFLMHGVLDSADTWVIRGKESLAIALADAGYDVWCGNIRGNKYSRGHLYLDPERDSVYWDFSFHEHGVYDLPSLVDLVLLKTGAPKLNAIGHSQGNTVFYVMASVRPEYNLKVNVLTALAPICFLQHVRNPLATLIKVSPVLYRKALSVGLYEIPGHGLGEFIGKACSRPFVGYVKCLLGVGFSLSGYDARELEPAFFLVVLRHFPMSTSSKNLYHFGQVGRRRRFARFDYGPARNVEEYGGEEPPEYELDRVTMPVALLWGVNDRVSTVEDVALLRSRLPRVVESTQIHRNLTNHLDFVWGRTMRDYLFPHIFRILKRFRSVV